MSYNLENRSDVPGNMEAMNLSEFLRTSSLANTHGNSFEALSNTLGFLNETFHAEDSWVAEEGKKGSYFKWDKKNPQIKEKIQFDNKISKIDKGHFFILDIEEPFLRFRYHLIFPVNYKERKIYIGFAADHPFKSISDEIFHADIISQRLAEICFFVKKEYNEKQRGLKLESILNNLPQAIVFTENKNGETWLNNEALEIFNLPQTTKNISSETFTQKLAELKVKVTNKQEVELVGNNIMSLNSFPSSYGEEWIWKFEDSVLKVVRKDAEIAGQKGELWVFDNVSELYFANQRLNLLFRKLNVAYDEINANLTEFQSKSSGQRSITDLEAEESRIIQQYDNDDILGKVTHDLRTPFAKVYTIVQLLLTDNEENLSPQQVERIGLIKQVVADGLQIVKGFLDTGNMVLDENKIKTEVVDIQSFIDESLMPYELLSAKKNIIFVTQVLSTNLKVEVDKTYLKRIVDNLVSNAIKFSSNETQINYTIYQEGDEIIFSVKDQGPGLTDDDKTRVFKKYQQLSAKPIGTDESTGLGLYIVKTMVDRMGGRIWVESKAGKGAEFKVALKVKIQDSE